MKRFLILLTLLTFSSSAFAMPAAVIGVVVALGAGAAGATVATAIAIGMAAASFYMASNAKVPSPAKSQSELKQLLRSSRAAKQVVYGKGFFSGAMIYAEEQEGDKESGDGTYAEYLYMAVGVCNHPVQQVHKIQLNETDISEFDGIVDYKFHNNPTTVDQYLVDNSPSWKSDMIGKGTSWLRLGMKFDRDKFANGVPTPRVELSGENRIWDPRTDSIGYTNNAALVIADYMIRYRGYTRDRIITQGFGSFIDAANLCDENVTNPDGSINDRYTINGLFTMDEKPGQVLDDMLTACGGQLVRIGGKIGLLPAAYYGPATFTITSSDLLDDNSVQIQPEPSYGDSVNTIKGTFIDPSQNYVETDYPTVSDANALARDGGELATDLNFRFVTNPYQAQRLADIELRRSISGGSVVIKTNLRGLYARLGRVIKLDIKELNLIGEYRVVNAANHVMNGVELSLMRDSIDIYDDATGKPFVPPPLTNLPTGGIAPPSGVQFLVESIGEVVQGQIQWQINAPQYASNDVRIKKTSDNKIIQVGSSIGNTYKINGLPADNYTVEVRTVDMRGAVSTWASASFVVDIPNPPSSVTVNRSNWNIELIPNIAAGIPTGTLFEFWYLADDASYIKDAPTYGEGDRARATKIFTGSSFNHGGRTPDRWHHYWIRSVSVYGQSDYTYVQTGTTREQDLVTTVVERLEAIEIQSANWTPDPTTGISQHGYKLFSPASGRVTLPDGTVLENSDGLAVFQDAVVNGHITAESLTFVDQSAIPPEINNANVQGSGNPNLIINGSFGDAPLAGVGDVYEFRNQGLPGLSVGDKISIAMTGKTDGTPGQSIRMIIYAKDWSWSTNIETQSTSYKTVKSESIILGGSGDYMVGIYKYPNSNSGTVFLKDWKVELGGKFTGFEGSSTDSIYPNQDRLNIKSENYSPGVSGWAIDYYGNAEFNNATIRGTLYAPDIEGDIYSTVTWHVTSLKSHIAYKGQISEVEYLAFKVTNVPGMDRILVIPPIQCDTQGFRLYEDGVHVVDIPAIDDPGGFDDTTAQLYHRITTTGAYGREINYSLRTYDYIDPGSIIDSKAIRIPAQIVQMYYGKADVIVI
ncbi:TMhelix containing protein [Vibrio phage 393E50-1]|nr:TMhelix containing protein [Vibrio phage 393E50-1]